MKSSIYTLEIHSFQEIFKVTEGRIYLLERKGKKYIWTETLMEESRAKKLAPISEEQLAGMFIEARKDHFHHINQKFYQFRGDV